MGNIQIEIRNLSKLRRDLQSLPDKIQKKALRNAVKMGALIVEEAVKKDAPRGATGRLYAGIRTKVKTVKDGEAAAEVRSEKWYSRLVEKGHKWIVKRNKKVLFKGYKAKDPFMANAFEESKDAAAEVMEREILSSIEKEWAKLGS